jgi:hypothetical protein
VNELLLEEYRGEPGIAKLRQKRSARLAVTGELRNKSSLYDVVRVRCRIQAAADVRQAGQAVGSRKLGQEIDEPLLGHSMAGELAVGEIRSEVGHSRVPAPASDGHE